MEGKGFLIIPRDVMPTDMDAERFMKEWLESTSRFPLVYISARDVPEQGAEPEGITWL